MNVHAEHVFGAEPAYVIKGLDPNARSEGNQLVALYDATPVWNNANRFNDSQTVLGSGLKSQNITSTAVSRKSTNQDDLRGCGL